MFNNEKLDKLFEGLGAATQDYNNILKFNKIANAIVQEAINIHWKEMENNAEFWMDLLEEIIKRLKLCVPSQLPYYPVLAIHPDTQEITFGFAKKGVKLPLVDKNAN